MAFIRAYLFDCMANGWLHWNVHADILVWVENQQRLVAAVHVPCIFAAKVRTPSTCNTPHVNFGADVGHKRFVRGRSELAKLNV